MESFSEFASRLDGLHAETLRTVGETVPEIETSSQVSPADSGFAALFSALRELSQDQLVSLQLLLSEESFSNIENASEFETRLQACHSANRGASVETIMSKTSAKRIIGYGVKNESVGGRMCSVYHPTNETKGPVFNIPHHGKDGVKIHDTMSGLLVKLSIKLAEEIGVGGTLIPDMDMGAYSSQAAKGGRYRDVRVVSPDSDGVLLAVDDGSLVAYDVTGATTLLLRSDGEDKRYPFLGPIRKLFVEANLVVNPNGTVNVGDGVKASGPYDPSSFYGGTPDSTDETLTEISGLIHVDKDAFKERFKLYMVASPCGAVPKAQHLSTANVGRISYDAGWKSRACGNYRRTPSSPHLVMNGVNTKTIDVGCRYVYGGNEEEQVEENSSLNVGSLLENKAASALLWLKNQTGSQLSELDSRYPDIFEYSTAITAYIGKGARRDRLAHYVRSHSRGKAVSLLDAAADADALGLLPACTLDSAEGEFVASNVLVFVSALLKWCASITFSTKDGLNSVFYWDSKC